MSGIWCTDLELSGPLPEVLVPAPSRTYDAVRVLVRLHGRPMGFVELPAPGGVVDVAVLLKSVDRDLGDAVAEHLAADGLPPVGSLAEAAARHSLEATALTPAGAAVPVASGGCPSLLRPTAPVTLVVCTRGRPATLRGCLRRLRELGYPSLEILIVDNAPPDDATLQAFTETVGDDERFRYLREDRPGLSCARNRGLREATGDLVAWTDDDVSVDADWIRALAAAFADPQVACVTGLVCTASIDGPAERYFDARVSWGDSCRPAVHRLGGATDDGLFPYAPGIFGTGANFAVRTAVMRELGGFDEALGAGTRTAGGEDLDTFVRIVLAGHALAYEPAALVWHHHRADLAGLRQQMFAYGTGLSAFLVKHLLDPATRREVLRRVPRGAQRLVTIATGTHGALHPTAPADDAAVVVAGQAVSGEEGAVDAAGGGRGAATPVPSGRSGRPDPVTAAGTGDSPDPAVPVKALLVRELAGFLLGPVLYARARRAVPPAVR